MSLTRKKAKKVLEEIVGKVAKDAFGWCDKEAYLSKNVVKDKTIQSVDGKNIFVRGSVPYWFGFVDDHLSANWQHPCRYVLIYVDGSYDIIQSSCPPVQDYKLEKII